jgi:hypothetical protein
MIIYNVTINIDESVKTDWLEWMKENHIPDILATGLFTEAKMSRILAEEAGGLAYSVQYTARNNADLEKYEAEHAPALQADYREKFGQNTASFRTILEVVHHSNG